MRVSRVAESKKARNAHRLILSALSLEVGLEVRTHLPLLFEILVGA